MKAGIVGATGYSGAELIRLLHAHPNFNVTSLYSSSKQGQLISEHFPHLSNVYSDPLEDIIPEKMATETDIVFLAVPSGIATTLAPNLLEAGCKVVDLSGDFRLKDPSLYEEWYGKTPPTLEWLEQAVYSIPELHRSQATNANFISNPGCYPTATILGLAPLVQATDIVEGSIIIDAKSGASGAGQNLSIGTLYGELNENFKIYKVNEHQHIPEIEQNLSLIGHEQPITFQTHLVPMTRGILATIYASVHSEIELKELYLLYKNFYKDEPFIRIRELGTYPATKEVLGSNYCDIGLAYDKRTKRVTIVSVIDNLVKGAAGQAVQNANIMFGFEETLGLNMLPVYP